MTSEKLDSEKSELTLGISAFSTPEELTGVAAWTKLIKNLVFMKKGSYPTDPEMGVDIGKYEYAFIDEVINDITNEINDQVRTYLPDIPFDSVVVTKETTDTDSIILLIVLTFTYNGDTVTSVIASENDGKKFNIEEVW